MFAIVEIGGVQYNVTPNNNYNVPLLSGMPGDKVEFGNILALNNGTDLKIGNPYTDGKVTGTIVSHGKFDKVIVFHKKRRKGYQKLNGHRQRYTQIEINEIN